MSVGDSILKRFIKKPSTTAAAEAMQAFCARHPRFYRRAEHGHSERARIEFDDGSALIVWHDGWDRGQPGLGLADWRGDSDLWLEQYCC